MMFPLHASESGLFFFQRSIYSIFPSRSILSRKPGVPSPLYYVFILLPLYRPSCVTQARFYSYPELLYNTYHGVKHKSGTGRRQFSQIGTLFFFFKAIMTISLFTSRMFFFQYGFNITGWRRLETGPMEVPFSHLNRKKERKATGKAMLLILPRRTLS